MDVDNGLFHQELEVIYSVYNMSLWAGDRLCNPTMPASEKGYFYIGIHIWPWFLHVIWG